MKLSISMIVRCEESCLATALSSVKEADEIVIVDTKLPSDPADRTQEIARSFGAKIYEQPWEDDFSKARNYSLSKCTGDWVYIIDADEELEPGGIEKVRKAIAEVGDAKTIYVRTISKTGTDKNWSQRIFKRCPEVYWVAPIHNHLNITIGPYVDIKHYYGYSEAHQKDPNRALRILADYLTKNPKAVREAYYLAREYWYRKDYVTALVWYKDYLSKQGWAPERADAWLMTARCLWNLRRGEEARDACLQAIKINTYFKEAILFMAELSGPKNKKRWLEFAKTATNEDVLFVRD